jgi:hypothetical protein
MYDAVLGQTLPSVIKRHLADGSVRLDRVCHHLLKCLNDGSGVIAIATSGSWGSSGMHNDGNLLRLDAYTSRKGDIRSTSRHRAGTQVSELLRIASQLTVSHRPQLMAMSMAVDNRLPLPPFMPIGRNEDGVFGQLVNELLPDAFTATLPVAVRHINKEATDLSTERLEGARSVRLCDILMGCLESSEIFLESCATTPQERLRLIGSHLVDIGSLATEDFAEFIRPHLLRRVEREIIEFENVLRRFDNKPKQWAREVKDWCVERARVTHDPLFIIPLELRRSEMACLRTKTIIEKFGRLLGWWPNIVAASEELKQRDSRLARPLWPV